MTVGNNRVSRLFESDDNKIAVVTAVVAAAQLFQQEDTRQAKRLLAGAVRDCLQWVLDREPTRDEVLQVLRKEM